MRLAIVHVYHKEETENQIWPQYFVVEVLCLRDDREMNYGYNKE